MSDHLTALDGTFLELEDADESAHMHIGAIMVFDPPPGGCPPSYEQLCRDLEKRLVALPRYRQKLSSPHTGGMRWPQWQKDPAFDVARHVGRAALPAPGGNRELSEWSSAFFSQRLDRRHPLWEMVLVEGLTGGRWAIASKTHHCMVDGVGSVDVVHLLLDPTAEVRRSDDLPSPPASIRGGGAGAREQTRGRRLGPLDHLAQVLPLEEVGHAAQMGLHGLLHPREALGKARDAVKMVVQEELHPSAHTSLNDPIGTRRRFEVVRVPLATLREIKAALGGTVNDVALCAMTGALRELLLVRGEELPEQGLRAMVPMNVRSAGERLALGNKISSLFVELPVIEASVERRYRETMARTAALKDGGAQAAATSAVIDVAGLAPPVVHSLIAQSLYATRLFNLTITNVPGPRQTLYSFGSALREVHPLVPLAASHAVGVALVSYDGEVFFGVVADPDAVPDLDVMLGALERSFEDMLDCARSKGEAEEQRDHGTAHAELA